MAYPAWYSVITIYLCLSLGDAVIQISKAATEEYPYLEGAIYAVPYWATYASRYLTTNGSFRESANYFLNLINPDAIADAAQALQNLGNLASTPDIYKYYAGDDHLQSFNGKYGIDRNFLPRFWVISGCRINPGAAAHSYGPMIEPFHFELSPKEGWKWPAVFCKPFLEMESISERADRMDPNFDFQPITLPMHIDDFRSVTAIAAHEAIHQGQLWWEELVLGDGEWVASRDPEVPHVGWENIVRLRESFFTETGSFPDLTSPGRIKTILRHNVASRMPETYSYLLILAFLVAHGYKCDASGQIVPITLQASASG